MLEFEKPIVDLENKILELQSLEKEKNLSFQGEIRKLNEYKNESIKKIYKNLDSWQITQIARHPKRPTFSDYINFIFSDFVELHGDRYFADDPTIKAGFAYLDSNKVVIIGQQKGRNTEENIKYNFGMPKPEGYRKAHRIMQIANKFKKPIITFIDTPGAYPGIEAEERCQSKAIADNLFLMPRLNVPIICVIIGEGGSGGALALGVGDIICMLSYSIYSVISPEGCASILWKDASKASEAARRLKITARELFDYKIIDRIIPEPIGGAHRFSEKTAANLKKELLISLESLKKFSAKKLIEKRHDKFMNVAGL